jgi:hypothetical protein
MTQMKELGSTNGMTNDTPLDDYNRMKVYYPNRVFAQISQSSPGKVLNQ